MKGTGERRRLSPPVGEELFLPTEAWLSRGLLLQDLGRGEEAVKCFNWVREQSVPRADGEPSEEEEIPFHISVPLPCTVPAFLGWVPVSVEGR